MRFRSFFLICVTIAAIVAIWLLVDFAAVFPVLSEMPPYAIAIAGALITCALILTYFRFAWTLRALGVAADQRSLLTAFVIGTLAGQFILSLVGQSFTRAAVLERRGIPVGATVAATFIERALAAATLTVAAIPAAVLLFGTIELDYEQGGAYFLSLVVTATIVLAFAGGRAARVLVKREHYREALRVAIRLGPVVGIGIAVQLAMLGAYYALIYKFAGGVAITQLISALILVMFAASIPISFAGWGLREFSAIIALNAAGISGEAALVMAVAIGGLVLLIVSVSAALTAPIWLRTGSAGAVGSRSAGTNVFDLALIWTIGILTACLIFFQVQVTVVSTQLIVNAADPFALTAVGLAIYFCWRGRFLQLFDRPIIWSVLLLAAMFAASAVYGVYNFGGGGQWAFVNRVFGFLVLLGYAAAPALVVMVAREQGRALLAETFLTSIVIICVLYCVAYLVHAYLVPLPGSMFGRNFEIARRQFQGFAQNSNAFAFQLLMIVPVLIGGFLPTTGARLGNWRLLERFVVPLLVTVGIIWLVQSRAGAVTALAVFIAVVGLNFLTVRTFVRWGFGVVLVVSVVLLAGYLVSPELFFDLGRVTMRLTGRYSIDVSDNERMQTVVQGIKLWLQHPVFGAGLGASAAENSASPALRIIHSVPVWFLAEMGVVGCLVYVAFIAALLYWVYQAQADRRAQGALLAILVFVLMGMAHDIFYQRTFWFGLGLIMATPAVDHEADFALEPTAATTTSGDKSGV